MTMLRELLVERVAPSRQYSDRTTQMYGWTLDRFEEFLERPATLDDLDDAVAGRFIQWRKSRSKVSIATCVKDSVHLRSLWVYCAKKRLKKSNGTEVEWPDYRNPVVPKPVPRAYTADELARLVAFAKRRRGYVGPVPAAWYWMTKLMAMYQTGERIGAVLEIRWREVDLERQTLTFLAQTRKGRRATKTLPITERLCQLMSHEVGPPDARVWPWLDVRHPLSLYNSMKGLCRSAGVEYKSLHAIRKSTASYLKRSGISAREQLGHASDRMAELHYYDEEIVGRANHLDVLPDIE
jgi:integrase